MYGKKTFISPRDNEFTRQGQQELYPYMMEKEKQIKGGNLKEKNSERKKRTRGNY